MANINPPPREELAEFEPYFEAVQRSMGFIPNSLPTMGLRPEILRGFAAVSSAVLGPGTVDLGLKQMVALMASTAAGCRYCQAHTAAAGARRGVDIAKLGAMYEFETNDIFDPGERAALRLARDAAVVPNATGPEHFAEARKHFNDAQIVEIVSVISLFGWLNRWNDTMATDLESEPLEFASAHLAGAKWLPGKHAANQD